MRGSDPPSAPRFSLPPQRTTTLPAVVRTVQRSSASASASGRLLPSALPRMRGERGLSTEPAPVGRGNGGGVGGRGRFSAPEPRSGGRGMDTRRQRRKAYALRETMLAMKPPLVLVAE